MRSFINFLVAILVKLLQWQCQHVAVQAFSLPSRSEQLPSNVSRSNTKTTFTYTHLECNGQLWQIDLGVKTLSIVVDPLASQLDFGIPWGYRANKKSLSEEATIDLICNANPTHCLLTMGLDDHTHMPTIILLQERLPLLEYVVAPSAEKKLLDSGVDANKMTVLKHGQSYQLISEALVTATPGALVRPPWQMRENGFLLQTMKDNTEERDDSLSIYYEPHNDIVLDDIESMKLRADIMVMPVTEQSLNRQFTLVYGGERALQIAEALKAACIIPLGNGVLNSEGPLAQLVQDRGNIHEFKQLLNDRNDNELKLKRKYAKLMTLEQPAAGVPLRVM